MEIDLGQEIVIKVKLGDKCYELREPTVADIESLQHKTSEDETSAARSLQDFVVALGMPREVVESLGFLKLQKLSDGLTNTFSEKK